MQPVDRVLLTKAEKVERALNYVRRYEARAYRLVQGGVGFVVMGLPMMVFFNDRSVLLKSGGALSFVGIGLIATGYYMYRHADRWAARRVMRDLRG